MRKIGWALTVCALLTGGVREAHAQGVPGLTALPGPGTVGAPDPNSLLPTPIQGGQTPPGTVNPPGLTAETPAYATPQSMAQAPLSYRNPFGMAPKIGPDFWKGGGGGFFANRINAGTVMTGVLEDTIASNKSKEGDIFSVRLEEGFPVDGNKQLIPPMSKIIGTISRAQPAKKLRNGMPGTLTVSMQTLVFPNGSSIPIYAFIDHNPSADMNQRPGSQIPDVAGFGKQTLRGAVSLITGRVGVNLRMPIYGNDLKLQQGEALAVRLTRPLDLSNMTPATNTAQTPMPGSLNPASLAGPTSSAFPPTAPPYPSSQSSIPGLAPLDAVSPTSATPTPLSAPQAGSLSDPF